MAAANGLDGLDPSSQEHRRHHPVERPVIHPGPFPRPPEKREGSRGVGERQRPKAAAGAATSSRGSGVAEGAGPATRRGDTMVDLRSLKQAAEALGPAHPLRVLVSGEPDEIPREEYVSKILGWYRLARTPRD